MFSIHREMAIIIVKFWVLRAATYSVCTLEGKLSEINDESIVQGKIRYMPWDEALAKLCCLHVV